MENPKSTLFIRGESTSEITQSALNDLYQLKTPLAQKFSKKNKVHPFEDAAPMEFFSVKNDTSLLCLATHSKKRPHNLTFARTFDGKVLDMYELGLNPETFRTMASFKNATGKVAVGMKPMILFSGAVWDSADNAVYAGLKSYFLDFFRGSTVEKVDVSGLQYIITISAVEPRDGDALSPPVHLRVYKILTKRSGHKLPRVELEEMGPRMDFSVRRHQAADADMLKEAMRESKKGVPRTKKNVEMDIMGDKLGRIHVGNQDLDKLQSRKMKGLKRRKGEDEDGDGDGDVDMEEGGVELPKKKKKSKSE